jgi:hypothetical protein
LYRHYASQTKPQPAWLYIRPEDGVAEATYNPEIGNAVPMAVWRDLHLTVGLPCNVRGDALADWLESEECQSLLERIREGHSRTWTGQDYRGVFTEDGRQAYEELEELAMDWPESALANVCSVGDYISSVEYWAKDRMSVKACDVTITAKTEDEVLENLAEAIESDALAEGYYIYDSVYDYLESLRKDCVPEDEEEEA